MWFDYHKMCALILISVNWFSTFTFLKNQGELNHIIIEKHKFNCNSDATNVLKRHNLTVNKF